MRALPGLKCFGERSWFQISHYDFNSLDWCRHRVQFPLVRMAATALLISMQNGLIHWMTLPCFL